MQRFLGGRAPRAWACWPARRGRPGVEIETVFLGGGTPSLLEGDDMAARARGSGPASRCAPGVEVTVECNPESVSATG